jgi:ParB family chromosome partitioning protein
MAKAAKTTASNKTTASKAPKAANKPRKVKPAAGSVGLSATECAGGSPSPEVATLRKQIDEAGGSVLACYREPFGGHWVALAALPLDRVKPTPYQRELSKAHADRLASVIPKVGRFLDPVIAVPDGDGFISPNGMHRLQALTQLGAKTAVALVMPEPEIAFRILALNTEKAHNLKEKSLEVIRMYRALAAEQPSSTEEDWAFQFESAHFITLGVLYEGNKRFAGGAFAPILRRVDKFLKVTLRKGVEERTDRAARVREADEALGVVVAKIKKRGINHPYVKNYVLARTTPLTRARKTLPSFEQTFKKLRESLEEFDVAKVRYDEIQRSAIMAIPAAGE